MEITRGCGAGAVRLGPPAWLVLLVYVLCSTVGALAGADESPVAVPRSSSAADAVAPTAMVSIPVARIAPSAAQVAQTLRLLATDLPPGDDIRGIREALPASSLELGKDLERALSVLKDRPSLEGLQTQEQYWYNRQLDLTTWLSALTTRATRLQEALNRLDQLQATWTLTRQDVLKAGAPAAILQQVDDTLAAIAAAIPQFNRERDDALDLQGQIAREVARCETARTRIQEVQLDTATGLFGLESRPLWSPALWSEGLAELPNRPHQIASVYSPQIAQYLHDPAKRMPLNLLLFVIILTIMLAGRARVRQWREAGHDVSRTAFVFERPYSASLLMGLAFATAYWSSVPPGVKDLMGAVAIIPLVVFVRPRLSPAARPAIYALGLFFVLDRVRHAFVGTIPLIDQIVVFTESLVGIVALVWFLLHLRRRRGQGAVVNLHWVWPVVISVSLSLLAMGLLASLLGNLYLARLTSPAVMVGGMAALWLYAYFKVASALSEFMLWIWPLRRLHLVQNHRERLVILVQRGLTWLVVFGWWLRLLDYLGLLEGARIGIEGALDARLTLGAFSTSAGEVLAFAITLWVAYLLSVALRYVLEEDVYPRIGISKGISYASTSLLRYTIGLLAILIGLGFLGVTLTQVTVFAGALGVGVGFGLQGVVQNFVAGLILLFEQPIHVGDAVQIGELQGRVRRIGIRASLVHTVQGADVIIPNSQLTAKQVTNWTLTDQRRRLDLAVSVCPGSQPQQAIELLEGVALAHPMVLHDPPPRCLFLSYSENAIDFELRVWADYDIATDVRSALMTAVYEAVYAAGMGFPDSPREVLLVNEGSSMRLKPSEA